TTPIHHSGTFPAGGALRLSGHRPADSGGLVARLSAARAGEKPRLFITPAHSPQAARCACPGTGPQTAVDW
ncbi:hypothetical protein, partial [Klebsiella michiganensis]